MRDRLNRIFAEATGQDHAKVLRETERNLWIPAKDACAYGLVHRVVESLSEI
jgi:ATP-dependent Clp protease protease subunit